MNKRGLSVIIGYILLVSIGLALSAMVYSWLVFYVPSEEVEVCPDGLSLSIREVKCDSRLRDLSFNLKNTGLFSIDGFTVKVNDKPFANIGVFLVNEEIRKIVPGDEFSGGYDYSSLVSQEGVKSDLRLLEVQPLIKSAQGEYISCQPSVKEVLDCSFRPEICDDFQDNDGDGLIDCDDEEDCKSDFLCAYRDPGFILYYNFDGENRANGLIGDSFDGTLSGSGVTWVEDGGYKGDAYEFDGGGRIRVGYSFGDNQPISVFTWVKANSFSDLRGVITSLDSIDGSGWLLYINGSGQIGTYLGAHKMGVDSINLDAWHYIGFTYDGDNLSIYRDGVKEISYNNVGYSGSNGLFIGSYFDGTATGLRKNWVGFIDEVRIYNYGLSEADVSNLYNFYEAT